MPFPDYNQFVAESWGWNDESAVMIGTSLGIVLGTNPPYSVADFLAFYPKFGGRPVRISGELTSGSPVVTIGGSPVEEDVDEFAAGQMVAGVGIPSGALIQSVDSETQITLTLAATSSAATRTTSTKAAVSTTATRPQLAASPTPSKRQTMECQFKAACGFTASALPRDTPRLSGTSAMR